VPASALEPLILASRVVDYATAQLDELTATGEVVWAGHGTLPGNDGWVSLHLADTAHLMLPLPDRDLASSPVAERVVEALEGGVALFFRSLAERVGSTDDADLVTALWDLVWAGLVTNDTMAPLRTMLGRGRAPSRRRAPVGRYYRGAGRGASLSRSGPPMGAGRWSLLPERVSDPTRRAHALAEVLLDRHGIVTRGAVMAERVPGGFAGVYAVLKVFEETGRARRGYFVEGLGASQFAVPGAVDRMRATAAARPEVSLDDLAASYGPLRPSRRTPEQSPALVLAAADPAQPYGAALAWPERVVDDGGSSGHKPGRKAGALVVLVEGELVLYVERGGKSLLSWTDDVARLQPAVDALALAVRDGTLGKLAVERADGDFVLSTPLGAALEQAGFRPTPRGLRLRA
jgi:ATP-dependent Lhr-like helicase